MKGTVHGTAEEGEGGKERLTGHCSDQVARLREFDDAKNQMKNGAVVRTKKSGAHPW